MKRMTRILILMLGWALFAPADAVLGQREERDDNPRKAELQGRFKGRHDELVSHKRAGRIGETTDGLVEAVKREFMDDAKVRRLIEEENRDRRELYKIIAEETGATPEVVAEQNARRNYQRARAGEYLKTADGEWRQKK